MCGTGPWLQRYNQFLSICNLSRLLGSILSFTLTGVFALVGALIGAITGGLAERVAHGGLFRGAGLGAVAGAVLSVEFLEAYWNSDHSGPTSLPSLSDFVDDLISGRFVQESLLPVLSSTQLWELTLAELRYEELYDMFVPSEGRMNGAAAKLVQSLPKHMITQTNRTDASGDFLSCPICLQELDEGDIARTLPQCKHTFHLQCVDRWLAKTLQCPVCRQCI